MRVFVTGATGFIGSAVVDELLGVGHRVLGLARSEEKAAALAARGVEPHRGSIGDLDSLRAGAARSDGVIHLAFNHDFSTFAANCEDDRRVVETLGAALAGSGRPLIVTSGTGAVRVGRPATEDDAALGSAVMPRAASEEAAATAAAAGANVSVVRLPQVHDTRRQGLVSYVIDVARQKGVSAYVGDGGHRWSAVHLSDAARLYRLALEKAESGSRYHAVGEEGVRLREIAEVVGRRLGIAAVSIAPDEAVAHFGWLSHFAGHDMSASGERTRQRLGWQPDGPGLIADLERMRA
ncbi:SDR family oxidoreductase [Dokdonella ginsengisoli]|uniref:SDR family oxidoreductase n=1 Tax=Dokdonella ginsengisoli TaxID=363846 RepID=A0ABV9R044_9GAMM